MTERIIGQMAAAGFQIGVRRTLPASREQLWTWLLSRQGLAHWLGELDALPLESGLRYETAEGAQGELRVIKPLEQLRFTWQPPGWPAPSTVQIRLLAAAAGKTTLSFHQEKLADALTRERMKLRWEAAIDAAQAAMGELNQSFRPIPATNHLRRGVNLMAKKKAHTPPPATTNAAAEPAGASLKELLRPEVAAKLNAQAAAWKAEEASRKEESRKLAETARKAEEKRLENDFEHLLNTSKLDWRTHK